MPADRGLLISFDGIDSSGKETQANLLQQRLQQSGREVIKFATPDYSLESGARLKRLFQGLDGGWDALSWTDQMSLIAANRAEHRDEVNDHLQSGGIVIYDRYVPSSLAHMAVSAKRQQGIKRPSVHRQVRELEHDTNGLPHEDLSIFLDMPPKIADQLLTKRKIDLQEADELTDDEVLQQEIYQEYLWLTSQQPDHFMRVACLAADQLCSPADIHQLIWRHLINRFPQLG